MFQVQAQAEWSSVSLNVHCMLCPCDWHSRKNEWFAKNWVQPSDVHCPSVQYLIQSAYLKHPPEGSCIVIELQPVYCERLNKQRMGIWSWVGNAWWASWNIRGCFDQNYKWKNWNEEFLLLQKTCVLLKHKCIHYFNTNVPVAVDLATPTVHPYVHFRWMGQIIKISLLLGEHLYAGFHKYGKFEVLGKSSLYEHFC